MDSQAQRQPHSAQQALSGHGMACCMSAPFLLLFLGVGVHMWKSELDIRCLQELFISFFEKACLTAPKAP